MMTIHKQQIEKTDSQEITVPKNSKILAAQIQKGNLCIWYIIDVDQKENEKIKIYIYGTGHPIDEKPMSYIDSVQMIDGATVWHVFRGVE